MSGWTQRFERQSRTRVVASTLFIVVAVGVVDFVTGWELSFSVFYLLAVGLAAWFVGRRFALFISVLSVVVSLAGDLATGGRYSSRLVPWWNASIVLTFYFVVVSLLIKLRAVYGDLEARVKERTQALTQEMAERERIERELLEISEREQRRIGRDLHDSPWPASHRGCAGWPGAGGETGRARFARSGGREARWWNWCRKASRFPAKWREDYIP